MFLSANDSELFYSKAELLSTSKLHSLDKYWSKNRTNPTHQEIHEMIESILIQRGEKTLKHERLNLLMNLEKSFLISNPMGRLSANIIGVVTKILLSKNLFKTTRKL